MNKKKNRNKRFKLSNPADDDEPYLGYSLAKSRSKLSFGGLFRAIVIIVLTLIASSIIICGILIVARKFSENVADDEYEIGEDMSTDSNSTEKHLSKIKHMSCYQCKNCDENLGVPMKCPVKDSLCAFKLVKKKSKVWMSIRYCETNWTRQLGCSYPKGEKVCYCEEPGCNGRSMSQLEEVSSSMQRVDMENDEEFKKLKEEVGKRNSVQRFKRSLDNKSEISVPFNELPVDEQVKLAMAVMEKDNLTEEQKMTHIMKFYESEYRRKIFKANNDSDFISSNDFERVMMPEYFKSPTNDLSDEILLQNQEENHGKIVRQVETSADKNDENQFQHGNLFFGLNIFRKDKQTAQKSVNRKETNEKSLPGKRSVDTGNNKIDRYMIVSNLDRDSDYIVPEVDNVRVDGKNLILPEAGRNHYFIVPKSLGELKSQEAKEI
ncbi:hypothetical protein HELRODRAFT_173385 [Helobdella robusta]|uniref:Uncharacterized protein n=1 Tax=Helobdella robusta TaxID=6412 RepID=T1F6R4_HELRO|nr:hypothetical protein HELRODRAFT_173385 [Helobdella robusta]ESO03687.1 hypothetical protein HELRODRAFT_173385 [Helobdella robusta]